MTIFSNVQVDDSDPLSLRSVQENDEINVKQNVRQTQCLGLLWRALGELHDTPNENFGRRRKKLKTGFQIRE
jgi:hypothetical protein